MVIEAEEQEDSRRSWSFLNDFTFHCDVGDEPGAMEGELIVVPELWAPGTRTVRPAVLATVADVAAGLSATGAVAPRLPLTVDIDVRLLAPTADRLWFSSRLLKVGRNTVSAEVAFTVGRAGPLAAVSFLTFMASPRPQDLTPFPMDGMRTTGAMTVPLAEHVGARVRSPGAVEVTHRPFVQQAAGALQGGVVALVGEMAAETLADRPVIELDVRYLSSVRIGPARAVAAPMGSEHVRVEVRDLGNADRLAARIVARLAPPSPHPPS